MPSPGPAAPAPVGQSQAVGAHVDVERTRAGVAAVLPEVLEHLRSLVAVPSVSAAAFDQAHVVRSAEQVAALLRDAGLPDVEILRATRPDGSPGAPAVLARRPAPPGAPTVLLYAHHDVQPPGAEAAWSSPPFEATERDGRLYGRGAADDKAGVCAHLAAVRTHLALHASDPDDTGRGQGGVGITVFVEGEEEIGSPSFVDFLHRYADRLRADVIVVADSTNAGIGAPALTTSLRGLVQAVVSVEALDHAVHSGIFGGAAPDALAILLRLLATLWHDDGSVAVPGLGELPERARPTLDAQAGWPAERFRAEAGVLPGVPLIGGSGDSGSGDSGSGDSGSGHSGSGDVSRRVWAAPSITVVGIDGPDVAHASNTLQPSARASLSVRVPPGADPRAAYAALEHHLLTQPAAGARVRVSAEEHGEGFAADTTSAGYRAGRWALATAWGVEPVDIGIGGSIPFIADLDRVMPDATVLVTGVEDPDSRAHGIDESLHLAEFAKACLAEALLLECLSAEPPEGPRPADGSVPGGTSR